MKTNIPPLPYQKTQADVMEVAIYHNPHCSKSRKALELLRGRYIEPEIIEYLKDPPTVEQLQYILKLLNISARNLIRKSERELLPCTSILS